MRIVAFSSFTRASNRTFLDRFQELRPPFLFIVCGCVCICVCARVFESFNLESVHVGGSVALVEDWVVIIRLFSERISRNVGCYCWYVRFFFNLFKSYLERSM